MRPEPPRQEPLDIRARVMIALVLLAFVASAFALVAALPLVFVRRRWPRELGVAAVVGVLLCAALAPFVLAQANQAVQAFVHPAARHAGHHHRRQRHHHHRHIHHRQRRGASSPVAQPKLPDWGQSASAAWPHVCSWWLLLFPSAPLVALLIELVRPRSLVEEQLRTERGATRTLERRRRDAARKARRFTQAQNTATLGRDEQVALLGAKVSGELVLPERRGAVGLPLEWLRRHALVIGPSGSGKTETLMRLAYGAAAVGHWPVYYLDAKADRESAERFRALMAATGRRCAVFPDTPFDCWRGDGRALYNRLIELPAFATEGDGAFYRDIAKRCLWFACCGTDAPPRSSAELLERLRPDALVARDRRGEFTKLGARELAGVSLRYASFFDSLGGALDSGFGYEDVDCAYLMLDALALKEDSHSLARLLVEDFAHFATQRKPREQPALLIVDELSAIADAARIGDLVERMRSFNVGVVLAPQVEAGISDDEAVSDRIVQNTETVIVHALKRPERIIELAGTRLQIEASYQHERGTATGMGSGQAQHVFKIDPNEVRALRPGECFVIRRGGVVRVQVARAPDVHAAIPPGPPVIPSAAPERQAPEPPSIAADLRL
jgi:hypothetical protein